ncbi:hypothetical protein ACFE04_027096 [Oxalis oulophora]
MTQQQQNMSNTNTNTTTTTNNNNISVNEVFWSLFDKAEKKFSKIRDLPYYERNRYDTYFYKVFKVYTQLWKFQQENRQKLVESGLKRWEIGEIASRIAQLYYGQYLRTSDASYLSQSYIFYEAILSREYFKEGIFQDLNLVNKQLRFLARFLMVCLVLNRRELVHQLVNQLKLLVDECKRTFPVSKTSIFFVKFVFCHFDILVKANGLKLVSTKTIIGFGEFYIAIVDTDFKEWKLVVQEIVRFLKADTAFMNIRPSRYSVLLDPHPDALVTSVAKRNLKLRDAILSSYHKNEVKFSELTLDTFRMLQCLEWEPSGSFYQTSAKINQNGAQGPSRINFSQDMVDPTLPSNPRKAILYHPTVTYFTAVLATVCEELPPDGVLLIYLSGSGRSGRTNSPPTGAGTSINIPKPIEVNSTGCLMLGSRGNGGSNCIFPSDLIPFTRRPLFIVIDSDCSEAFKVIHGAEKVERAAILLSATNSILIASTDSSRHQNGSLFTIFLTAPLQAFLLLLGFSCAESEMDTYNNAEKLVSSSLNDWGSALAKLDTLDHVWAQILTDPFLRRLLLRFLFCRAVLALYKPSFSKEEFHPTCLPPMPESVPPTCPAAQTLILQIADMFGVADRFIFSEGIVLPGNTDRDTDSMSSS